jgi:hypothetical protein
MNRRRALALLAVTGAVAAVPLAAAAAPLRPAPDTTSAGSWAAVAAADGVRISVVVNDFLVVSNVVDAGGPSTQAVVNAFGDSRGYAAFPYPGEIVLTAHGLSQGAAPKYPLIAQSDPTQPKSDVGAGPYHLHAQSADDSAAADAKTNGGNDSVATGLTHSSASAAHDAKTAAVTADAESTAEGVAVAGVLSIGRVHSHALMVSAPGKPVQRSSDTELADVTVAGQEVGITDKGLVLAGTDVPLPKDSTANATLSAAGITVHYLDAVKTPTSTVAPGLVVDVKQNVPGVGETTVSLVFGQASATAQSSGATQDTGVTTSTLGGATGPPSGSTGPTGAMATSPAGPTAGPTAATTGVTPDSPPITAGAPQQSQGGYALATQSGPSSESLYVVVAAGAVVMIAAAQLFRILAVKLAWT